MFVVLSELCWLPHLICIRDPHPSKLRDRRGERRRVRRERKVLHYIKTYYRVCSQSESYIRPISVQYCPQTQCLLQREPAAVSDWYSADWGCCISMVGWISFHHLTWSILLDIHKDSNPVHMILWPITTWQGCLQIPALWNEPVRWSKTWKTQKQKHCKTDWVWSRVFSLPLDCAGPLS